MTTRPMAARAVHESTFRLDAPPEAVFPLLCPVREYEWIAHWRCELLHSVSGYAEEGCVFRTDFPGDGAPDVWVCSRHEPPRRVDFTRVNRLRAIHYVITLAPDGAGTRITWRKTATSLGPEGDAWLAGWDARADTAHMAALNRMLEHYLATGEMEKMEERE